MSLIEDRKDSSGKNADVVYCTFCPSKILNSGAATFVNIEVCYLCIFSSLNI